MECWLEFFRCPIKNGIAGSYGGSAFSSLVNFSVDFQSDCTIDILPAACKFLFPHTAFVGICLPAPYDSHSACPEKESQGSFNLHVLDIQCFSKAHGPFLFLLRTAQFNALAYWLIEWLVLGLILAVPYEFRRCSYPVWCQVGRDVLLLGQAALCSGDCLILCNQSSVSVLGIIPCSMGVFFRKSLPVPILSWFSDIFVLVVSNFQTLIHFELNSGWEIWIQLHFFSIGGHSFHACWRGCLLCPMYDLTPCWKIGSYKMLQDMF